MIATLNDMIGLPSALPAIELALAADCFLLTLFNRASTGNLCARRDLIEVQIAYLNWAYAPPKMTTLPQANTFAGAACGGRMAQ